MSEGLINPEVNRQVLRTALVAAGVTATDDQIGTLAAHAEAVLQRNRVLNLTRITLPADVIRLHIVDSATALAFVDTAPGGAVADLGSGAGYPGLVLAVLSDRDFTLVESVKKKAAFLREVSQDLRIDVSIVDRRAEELALDGRGMFAAVTARALSSLPSLVELAAPLLAKNGILVALKGAPTAEEVRAGERAARLCGLVPEEVHRVVLPGGSEVRTILTYRVDCAALVRLPRRPGMAQRQPLA
ncbi:MAG: 16S rRNA (guanine(527)-N(7))-methyltransferase RsmG [Coriobacteriia bacterium]|nr:16S rRNA (guanine(527)-N(7))-methyltransferase RsmG [Coriobacteriia bacterium]